jgi:SAM-dependent methyltransferase
MDEKYWDDKYRADEQLWSGEPNGLLVAEASDLPPGQALDLGCGEGGDALWLASRGWLVTAIDISRTALERAAAAAGDAKVSWTHADLRVSPPPAGSFDLVSALYLSLPRTADHRAMHSLLAAVAPGGTLLFGGHDLRGVDTEHMDIDPHTFYRPDEVADLLDGTWTVLINEVRPRVSTPSGNPHVNDTVLKARKNT